MRLKDLDKDMPADVKLPISGADLIKMGMKPGPDFKKVLDKIQDAVDANPKLSRQQGLDIAKREIK